ncbi:MAG TPA: PAS domain-containing protein, partial [Alphaproteobacteria bacterium]|nr:PAS domain-containing protein [Alphaproteobacteria bacterium]
MTPIRILLLEDSAVDAELAAATLERLGQPLLIDRVDTREDFVAAVDRGVYDVILADYALPSFDGDAALAIVLERTPSTPFIFVSGVLGEEIAVDAMRKGATDFVVKQRMHRLPAAVSRAIEEVRQRRERQRMAAALHSLEDRLDRLIAATSSMVWSTDGAGRFVAPQPSLERLTGLPFDRYAGRGLLEAVHPDDRERVDLLWGRAVAGRTLFDTEFRLRQRDGSYRLVLARALPTLGEDGRVLEWLGTAIDIEDRRRAETALRDSETRLRLALEAGRLGSWELDPANGRLIASAACRAHFGRNPDAAFTFA